MSLTNVPAVPAPPSPKDVFVGREAEFGRLNELLEHAYAGAGRVVFLSSDAGGGKTLLATEFLRRAARREASPTLVRGRCVEHYGAGEAYLPFLDAIGNLLLGPGRERTLQFIHAYAPTWCLELPTAASSEALREALRERTIGATRERMLREMGDLLAASAADQVVLGMVEDLQWADPSTLELLRYVGNRAGRQRLLILGTFRPAELEAAHPAFRAWVDEHCEQIALRPFSPGDVAGYLAARFGAHGFPDELACLIHERTEGHPFFVTSLVQLLVERGDLAPQQGCWEVARPDLGNVLEAPESIRGMVRRRLAALSPAGREVLQHASVLGREFLSTVLADLLGVEEAQLEERLAELRRVRLLRVLAEEELADGRVATRLRFTNALYAEVIYEDLLAQRRAALHRRAGELLERHSGEAATRNAAQIALHFERGRDPARAARYLAHAGDNATRLLASHEAESHYARALALISRLPPDQEQPARLELLRKRGLASLALSRFEPAVEMFTQLLEAAGVAREPELEAQALAGLCDALFFSHRIEEMAVRAEQALYGARTSGSAALHRQALLLVAQILQEEGRLAECGEVLDEVLPEMRAAGEHRGLLRGLAYRGSLHYWQTEYPEAVARLGEALELARQQRDGLAVLICLQFLGLAHGNCGAIGRAKAILRESLELARRNEDRFWLPHLATHLGWLHRELLDVEGALPRDVEALHIAREAGVEPAEANALLNLCLDYVAAGREAEATEAVRDIERLRARAGWFGWLYEIRFENVLAERCLAAAALDEAQLRAERVMDAAGSVGARTYVAGARRILAEAALARGDPAAARAHLREGLAVLGDRAAPLIRWRVNASLGRAARADGDAAAAREAFGRAAALMRELADNCDEAALRSTFLESGPAREALQGAGGGSAG
jgi:hypothetical protein